MKIECDVCRKPIPNEPPEGDEETVTRFVQVDSFIYGDDDESTATMVVCYACWRKNWKPERASS